MIVRRPVSTTLDLMPTRLEGRHWGRGQQAELRDRLAAGALVAFPTETFYGLGCDPHNEAAVERLLGAKGRPARHPLPLIAASAPAARIMVTLQPEEERSWKHLTGRFWPGPLTLVATARPGLASGVLAGGESVGLRVSSHEVASTLAAACGGVIVATSANLSGIPPSTTPAEVEACLGDHLDLLIDGGTCAGDLPSTVVDLRRGRVRLLRRGVIDSAAVLQEI